MRTTLYYLPGSLHSEAAKDALSSDLSIAAVPADAKLMAALWRDLGIGELPALVDHSSRVIAVGLDAIERNLTCA